MATRVRLHACAPADGCHMRNMFVADYAKCDNVKHFRSVAKAYDTSATGTSPPACTIRATAARCTSSGFSTIPSSRSPTAVTTAFSCSTDSCSTDSRRDCKSILLG